MNWVKSFCSLGILFLMVFAGVIISRNWVHKSSSGFQDIVEEVVMPELKQEILILQKDVQSCYNQNEIRYEQEFFVAKEIERLISGKLDNNDELLAKGSKLDTLGKKYFDENFDNHIYAHNYLEDNVYKYSPSEKHVIELNQFLLLYKTKNIMSAVHRNVCTSNDDNHLKKGSS